MNDSKNARNITLIENGDYNTLIEENEKLVYAVLQKFYFPSQDYDDYVQIGLTALYISALKFDTTRGDAKFSTYAARAIYNTIANALKANEMHKIDTISYDQEITNSESGEVTTILSFLESSIDTSVEFRKNNFIIELKNAIDKFPDKYKRIIIMYFIEDKTQTEIAQEMGYSRQYISRTCQILRDKIIALLGKDGIDENYF